MDADNAAGADADGADVGVDVTWEMSKENVKPLSRGRKVESLRRAFGGAHANGGGGGGGGEAVLAALKRFVPAPACPCTLIVFMRVCVCVCVLDAFVCLARGGGGSAFSAGSLCSSVQRVPFYSLVIR